MTTHPGTAPSEARQAGTPLETETADRPPATEDQPADAPSDARAARYARRVAQHADQERLARRFIHVAHERLAGRDPASRRLLGRQPRERVVLGVLAPQDPPTADPPVTVQDLPAEPGVPVDQLPASELGLTCLVAPTTDSLTIEATVRFALYLQHYPTYDEQLRHAALAADHDDPASAAEASPEAREETPPKPESPGSKPGRQAASPVPSSPPASPAVRPGSREASDAALLAFQRYDVSAPIRLTVPVPRDSIPVTMDDKGKLLAAAGHAIESQAGVSRPGSSGGSYRLLTSPAQRIPREAMADPDTFDQWLSANAQPGWAPPIAQPKFTATAHRDLSGQVRLALTLANAALRPERDHGLLADVSVYDAAFEATVSGGSLVNMGYRMIDADYRITPEVYAHGRFCCLDDDASDPASGRLATTAFPVFR